MKDLEILLALVAAVMQEKSIVCYGSNLNKVSGVILGLESLLRPFSWSMALVPILPEMLLDTLEAPVPILVGITTSEYEKACQNLSKEEMDTRIWVNAEAGTVEWSEYLHQPVTFSFENLRARLTPRWIELQKRIRKQRTEMHWIN